MAARRPLGRGPSPRNAETDELFKAFALKRMFEARCFDDEDRRMVDEHVQAIAARLSLESPREVSVVLAERRALLSVASSQGLLPTESKLFHAMIEKQLRLQTSLRP